MKVRGPNRGARSGGPIRHAARTGALSRHVESGLTAMQPSRERSTASTVFRVEAIGGRPGRATTTVFSAASFRAISIVEPHRTVVMLDGELDRSATAVFRPALVAARAHGRAVDIDCAGLVFIDASGIREVLAAVQEDPCICLVNVPRRIERLFVLIGELPR